MGISILKHNGSSLIGGSLYLLPNLTDDFEIITTTRIGITQVQIYLIGFTSKAIRLLVENKSCLWVLSDSFYQKYL
jgi:3-methyladenine DNA glycosylase Mpg